MVDEPTDDTPDVLERYAILDPDTREVITITEAAAATVAQEVADGTVVQAHAAVRVGDVYDITDATWTRPDTPETPAPVQVDAVDVLTALVAGGILTDGQVATVLGDADGTRYEVVDGTLKRTDT